jgi:hypothetical protein
MESVSFLLTNVLSLSIFNFIQMHLHTRHEPQITYLLTRDYWRYWHTNTGNTGNKCPGCTVLGHGLLTLGRGETCLFDNCYSPFPPGFLPLAVVPSTQIFRQLNRVFAFKWSGEVGRWFLFRSGISKLCFDSSLRVGGEWASSLQQHVIFFFSIWGCCNDSLFRTVACRPVTGQRCFPCGLCRAVINGARWKVQVVSEE